MEQFIGRISVAPMIDITYEHFRVFMRLLTMKCVLYTEMIHEKAIHNNMGILEYSQIEHPLVCQMGGNDPQKLASAAQICEKLGYDEVNLNVGCPSERVQDGAFGACLMKEPQLVAKVMREMKENVKIPCTLKCRLGVDQFDSYEFLREFIGECHQAGGVQHFIVHARKAYLKGLNPHENRTVPPLKYDYVYKLKQEFPNIKFTLNGGVKTPAQIDEILKQVDGVMLGRAAYENPWIFCDFDRRYFGIQNQNFSRREILEKYADFVEERRKQGNRLSTQLCVKCIINLFTGENHNKWYRQMLSNTENHNKFGSFKGLMLEVIRKMEEWNPQALDIRPNDYQFL